MFAFHSQCFVVVKGVWECLSLSGPVHTCMGTPAFSRALLATPNAAGGA